MNVKGKDIKNEKGELIGEIYKYSPRRMGLHTGSDFPILFIDKKFQAKVEPDLEIKDERGKVLAVLKKKKGWLKKKYIMEIPRGNVILKGETNKCQEIIQDSKGVRIAEIIKTEPSWRDILTDSGKTEIWTLKIENLDSERNMILYYFLSRYSHYWFTTTIGQDMADV